MKKNVDKNVVFFKKVVEKSLKKVSITLLNLELVQKRFKIQNNLGARFGFFLSFHKNLLKYFLRILAPSKNLLVKERLAPSHLLDITTNMYFVYILKIYYNIDKTSNFQPEGWGFKSYGLL